MKMSYHQYSRCAPLKPDISHGVMGLSHISMNHAVKEPLLKKKKCCKWISGEFKLQGAKVRRTLRLTNPPTTQRKETSWLKWKWTRALKSHHVLLCYYDRLNCSFNVSEWDPCYYRRQKCDATLVAARHKDHINKFAYSEALHIMNPGRWRCRLRRRLVSQKGSVDYSQWTPL